MSIAATPKKVLTAAGWIDGFEALVDGRSVGCAATEAEAVAKAEAHVAERITTKRAPTHGRRESRRAVTGHGRVFVGMRGFEDFV